jgi:hypothetical protein
MNLLSISTISKVFLGIRCGQRVGLAVGPTSVSIGVRFPTVGQPPFEPTVGLLPSVAMAVRSWPVGHVGDLPAAV